MPINLQKLGNMRRLLFRAYRSYARSFFALIILGFIGGLFEGVGIASVIPLFSLVAGQSATSSVDTITTLVTTFFSFLHIPLTPPILLGFIVALFIGKGFILFFIRYTNARIVSRFEEGMRRTLLERTLRVQWQHLMRQKVGHLESILIYDVERGSSILNTLANTIILLTTFSAYTLVAITISLPITLGTLLLGGIIFIGMKPIFYQIRQRQMEAAAIQKEVNHHVAEHMTAAKSIKSMALEQPITQRAFSLFARLRASRIRSAFFRQSSLAIIEPIGFIVIATLFMVSYRTPGFSLISFAVIMYLVQKLFSFISSISGQIQNINEAYPYLKTIMNWRRRSRDQAEEDVGTENFALTRSLDLQNVSFAYNEHRSVLNNISLGIPAGQLVGLIGPSGVGKTTLVDLLLRLLEPTSGQILADGVPIKNISLSKWRNHIGYVPQEAVLINASIRENIRFYSDATDEDIAEAARQANIHETIASLPDGYETSVGERGTSLSGGQRQRIILARALARKPSLLILDEATSAIDGESEQLIQQAIAGLRGKVTVIVITHRLSTANYLDRIIALDNGSVLEDGTPSKLLENSTSYLSRLLNTT
jgi:ABC-type multidrug transport system fused ATPase/permease subunit